MSQEYPGVPRTVANYLRQLASAQLLQAGLGVLYGLPALVFAYLISPVFAGYVLMALAILTLEVVLLQMNTSEEEARIAISEGELSRAELRKLMALLHVGTSASVTAMLVIAGGLGALAGVYLGPIIGVAVVVFLPTFDDEVLAPRGYSVRAYAFEAVLSTYNTIQSFKNNSENDLLKDFSGGGPMF